MADMTKTLPLKDLQDQFVARIEMMQGIKAEIAKAADRGGSDETRAFNAKELKRAEEKVAQLEKALAALNDACCPNPMDCPHHWRVD